MYVLAKKLIISADKYVSSEKLRRILPKGDKNEQEKETST